MNGESVVLRPLPDRDSDWSRDWNLYKPFWEGTREGVLMVQECQVTGKKVWPPRFLSPFAPGTELKWATVPTKGIVYTFNVVYRSFYPYFNDKVPYALVVVDLGDGVRMLGNTVDMDPTQIQIGMRMEAVFEMVSEQVTLVQWKPEEGETQHGE
jgi:uncharacterized OB-fold protein